MADIEAVTGAYKLRVSGIRVCIDLNEAVQQIKTVNMQSQEEVNLLAKQMILTGWGLRWFYR
jgi:hypothetical protein